MRPSFISADVLHQHHEPRLKWRWIAAQSAKERHFNEVAVRAARSAADLVGYLNYIHPYRVQVLGEREITYLSASDPGDSERRIARIIDLQPPLLVVCDDAVVPKALIVFCERAQIPLFASMASAASVIEVLRSYLSRHFADRTTQHGVFMDILGLGVLIKGESGIGKSELGLELISRGHGLVADDSVDLYRTNQTHIEGRCPEMLQNLLEVRGIGPLDIRTIFGETAVRPQLRLRMIVQLMHYEIMERDHDRFPEQDLSEDILGVDVYKVILPVTGGRNLAVLLEAAVRNRILKMRGIDTLAMFKQRQQEAMAMAAKEAKAMQEPSPSTPHYPYPAA